MTAIHCEANLDYNQTKTVPGLTRGQSLEYWAKWYQLVTVFQVLPGVSHKGCDRGGKGRISGQCDGPQSKFNSQTTYRKLPATSGHQHASSTHSTSYTPPCWQLPTQYLHWFCVRCSSKEETEEYPWVGLFVCACMYVLTCVPLCAYGGQRTTYGQLFHRVNSKNCT